MTALDRCILLAFLLGLPMPWLGQCTPERTITIVEASDPPELVIVSPENGARLPLHDPVEFHVLTRDGDTRTDDLRIRLVLDERRVLAHDLVPDLEGHLVFLVDSLPLGEHLLTAQVTDPQGLSSLESVSVFLIPSPER